MKKYRFVHLIVALVLSLSLCATPVVLASDTEMEIPTVAAQSALLVDLNTNTIMLAQNAYSKQYPASLTKIMTALLVFEAIDAGTISLDQEVIISSTAMSGLSGTPSYADLRSGEVLTVFELLECMLIVGADEAAQALAETVSGSKEDFVALMNQRATELGCTGTNYTNATGLHNDEHYTTAWDLYLVAQEAVKHEDLVTLCDTVSTTIPTTNIKSERLLYTTNALLTQFRLIGYTYPAADGLQSGYTEQAGYCLLTTAEDGFLDVVSVVLGAERVAVDGGYQTQSYTETSALLDWGFASFDFFTILETTEVLSEVPVTLSTEMNYVTLEPAQNIEVLLHKDMDLNAIERQITLYYDEVEAPIYEGDVLGEITLSYEGLEYGTVDLIARHSVSASQRLLWQQEVLAFIDADWLLLGGIAIVALILLVMGIRYLFTHRRYRYGKSVRHRDGNYHGRKR
ncbi:D-alanyl-D-alanine carboxypeptidase family protein [Bengtsoniella intestinalis]|uniref:D-alanyl-D-alanine carboxypeptidase family protein n=1 Tax=Bengtsoniella intestinalis TaxID=3073143 RepID=UPI00391F1BAA